MSAAGEHVADREFLYGPRDGDPWPAEIPWPEDKPVLVGTQIRLVNETGEMALLARYLPAENAEGRHVMMFDGWYVNAPGPLYGPRTGGLRL